jgi:hypothetical protein
MGFPDISSITDLDLDPSSDDWFLKTVVDDSVESFNTTLKDAFAPTLKFFSSIGGFIDNATSIIGDSMDEFGNTLDREIAQPIETGFEKNIEKPIKKLIEEEVLDPLLDMTNGIDTMIKNFARIVCFLNKSPPRFRNLAASLDNIFTASGEEFVAFGYALELGFNSISKMIVYIATYISNYIDCTFKILENFLDCVIFYVLDIIGQVLYLPIRIVLWVFKTFLQLDLYSIEKQTWEGLDDMDQYLFEIIGFKILQYPKHIRDNCYTCIRLRTDVIDEQADVVRHSFRKTIPEMLGKSKHKFEKGRKQFHEVFAYPTVREPKYVE